MDGRRVITFQRVTQNRQSVVSSPVSDPPQGRFADAQTFGEFLRNRRQSRGISLGRIAAETRLAAAKFEALERGDIARLPAGIYGRAVVRAYATAVGLDPLEVVGEFQHLVPAEAPPLPSAELVQPPAADRGLPRWAGSVAAALILGVSYWALALWTTPGSVVQEHPADQSMSAPASVPEPTELEVAATTGESAAVSDVELASNNSLAPTPPQTVVDNSLSVTSDPSGARVTVNGIGWGFTPLTIPHLPPGEKVIRLSKDGFSSVETTVTLAGDGPASVSLSLQPYDVP
jgi:transcriptional regulator with XRE-family HTH domain